MKKIILFFTVLLMLVSCSQMENELSIPQNETRRDGKISQEQARENLIKVRGNFYPETRGKEPVISSCVSYGKSMTPTTRSGEEPIIYVFNYEDNQGFAIMSATPALPEVLAISEKGNLDLQKSSRQWSESVCKSHRRIRGRPRYYGCRRRDTLYGKFPMADNDQDRTFM